MKKDCFGLLYDKLLTPCRDICLVRAECKTEVEEHIRQRGRPPKRPISTSISTDVSLKPPISETISRMLDICEAVGLKVRFKRWYIAIKDSKGRSMLHCSRLQTTRISGTFRFVRLKKRESFPPEIRRSVSHETSWGQYYFTGNTLEEFERVLKIYIDRVQAMLNT